MTEPICDRYDKTLCPLCGGSNGAHGLIHSRHENGGGSNKPCPNARKAADDPNMTFLELA